MVTTTDTLFSTPVTKTSIRHGLFIVLVMLFIGIFNQAWSKTLVTDVDNRQIEMGDIISVRVQADFQNYNETPDFESLKDQFEVLGTQRSSNMQIINGKYSTTTEWLAQLTPKQTGELRIPSFEIEGTRSNPISIFVTPTKAYGTENKITFIEAELNKTQAYVQEEVVYTLKFFHLGRLIDGSIRPPQFPNALSKQLKNQQTYQKRINGQLYEVFEWSYAFYPQQSGTLEIAPQDFTGRLHLGGQLRAIHDNSKALHLTVLPKPATFPSNASWLPAKTLRLTETWQTASQHQRELHVGDSLTRTVTLNAEGQLASQLPTLHFENQAGLQIYPDKSLTNDALALEGYRSEKLFKMAIIPTQAGKLTLPAISIPWWNTQTNQLETISLPAKTLDVLPALNSTVTAGALPAQPLPVPEANVSHETPATASHTTSIGSGLGWTLLFGGLWLITLVGFIWQTRQLKHLKQQLSRTQTATSMGTTPEQTTLMTDPLCEQTLSPNEFYSALNQRLLTQPDLLNNVDLQQNLQALKAHLFANAPLDENVMPHLCQLLKSENTASKMQKEPVLQLQPLYPTER